MADDEGGVGRVPTVHDLVVPGSRADLAWMDAGRCRGDGTEFFPDRGQRAEPAKVVCRRCPVRQPCLEYALRHEIVDGVWGGLGAQERLALIGGRRRARRESA